MMSFFFSLLVGLMEVSVFFYGLGLVFIVSILGLVFSNFSRDKLTSCQLETSDGPVQCALLLLSYVIYYIPV